MDIKQKALDLLDALDRQAEAYGEYRMVQLSEEDIALLRSAINDQAPASSLEQRRAQLDAALNDPPMGSLARDRAGYWLPAWYKQGQGQEQTTGQPEGDKS